MSVPLDLVEQKRRNWFKPNKKIGFYLGISKYDKIGIEEKGTVLPIPDMPEVIGHVQNFKACMEKYLIRHEESHTMLNPTPKEVEASFDDISKNLKEGKRKEPSRNIFVVLLFAGIGLQFEG